MLKRFLDLTHSVSSWPATAGCGPGRRDSGSNDPSLVAASPSSSLWLWPLPCMRHPSLLNRLPHLLHLYTAANHSPNSAFLSRPALSGSCSVCRLSWSLLNRRIFRCSAFPFWPVHVSFTRFNEGNKGHWHRGKHTSVKLICSKYASGC